MAAKVESFKHQLADDPTLDENRTIAIKIWHHQQLVTVHRDNLFVTQLKEMHIPVEIVFRQKNPSICKLFFLLVNFKSCDGEVIAIDQS